MLRVIFIVYAATNMVARQKPLNCLVCVSTEKKREFTSAFGVLSGEVINQSHTYSYCCSNLPSSL